MATLTADITRNEAVLHVNGDPGSSLVQIDAEFMEVVSSTADILMVKRGRFGTAQTPHSSGVTVYPAKPAVQTGAPVSPPSADLSSAGASATAAAASATAAATSATAAAASATAAAASAATLTVPQAVVAAVAGTAPAGGTGAAAGGWDTSGHRDTAITTINEIKTQFNALLAELKSAGVISSS